MQLVSPTHPLQSLAPLKGWKGRGGVGRQGEVALAPDHPHPISPWLFTPPFQLSLSLDPSASWDLRTTGVRWGGLSHSQHNP